ncbi:MAG: DUF115 domain-containing protein [Methanospirillaceae archaeon]|nr:DUF115 domain-containing protein [Methanospirillaceae archaeon]
MSYREWEPVYHEILDYFSFDIKKDREAAVLLSTLTSRDDEKLLTDLIKNQVVTICGNGPNLSADLRRTGDRKRPVITADAATDQVIAYGIIPDIIVTDLDGADEYIIDLNKDGTIVVVHAHGDNIALVKRWVPLFSGPLVCTTQAEPFANLHNYGGFTDGDRAAYLAHAHGAKSLVFLGFLLDDPDVNPIKRGKLIWARRLLADIGYTL